MVQPILPMASLPLVSGQEDASGLENNVLHTIRAVSRVATVNGGKDS